MICPQCGKEILDGANFCESCGAAKDAVAPNATEAANPFAVGSQTSNASGGDDNDDNDDNGYHDDYFGYVPFVPSNVFRACKMVLSKYFDCKGRASRTEFWYWQFFLFLVFGILLFLPLSEDSGSLPGSLPVSPSYIVNLIVGLIFLSPTLNLYERRVHDFNMPGWPVHLLFFTVLLSWFFLDDLIKDIVVILSIVAGLIPASSEPNKYGPKPMKR